jgi:hypothetical protein
MPSCLNVLREREWYWCQSRSDELVAIQSCLSLVNINGLVDKESQVLRRSTTRIQNKIREDFT